MFKFICEQCMGMQANSLKQSTCKAEQQVVCHNPERAPCVSIELYCVGESCVGFIPAHATLAASGAGDINYSALTPAGAIWQILQASAIGHQTEWPLSSNKDPTRSYCLFGLSFSLALALGNRGSSEN